LHNLIFYKFYRSKDTCPRIPLANQIPKGFTAMMANEFKVGGFNSEFKVQSSRLKVQGSKSGMIITRDAGSFYFSC